MKKLTVLGCVVMSLGVIATRANAHVPEITFNLVPQPKFLSCLAASSKVTPTAQVIVTRGELSDLLILEVKGVKPNLGFDLFTIQNSNPLGVGGLRQDGLARVV